jgi:hypothetical protein
MTIREENNEFKQTKKIDGRYLVALFKGDKKNEVETTVHIWASESGFSALKYPDQTPQANRVFRGLKYEEGLAFYKAIETEEDVLRAVRNYGERSNR